MNTTLEKLLAVKKANLTKAAYLSDLNIFARFLKYESMSEMPDSHLSQIKPKVITDFIAAQKVDGKVSSTIARRLTAIKELLTEAAFADLYNHDDLAYIKKRLKPGETKSKHHAAISPDEQNQLLEAAASQVGLKGRRDYLICRLMLETGIRRSELVGLQVKHLSIRAAQPTLYIANAKGDEIRHIGVEPETYTLLKRWLEDTNQMRSEDNPLFCRLVRKGRKEKMRYVVTSPGKHLNPASLNYIVKQLLMVADIKSDITPHSFRVAMVTDTVAGNAPLLHIQQVTGHKTTRLITEIYNRHEFEQPVSKYRKRKLYKPPE